MKTRKRRKTKRKIKRKKLAWEIAQDKFEKKSLKTKCGKRGGKYPTKKTDTNFSGWDWIVLSIFG